MPSGIIMSSSSVGATKEAIEKVLTENGHEPETPEVVPPVEPKREDFKSDEEFETAQETFEAEQEQATETAEEKAEKERLAALPHKSRKQKAIEKATRKLEDELRQTKDRLAALEGKAAPGEKKETPAAAAPKVPKREDFKSDAEFDDALFDFRYQQRRAKEQQQTAQLRVDAQLKENYTNYQTEVAAFKEEHDDWDEVVTQSKTPITDPVYYAIVELGKEGPAVTYYLGQHPEEIDKLAELTPYRAAIEVGRLADKLRAGTKTSTTTDGTRKPAPKKIPEPVKPVSTSATASSLTSREAAKNRDFKAFKAAQQRGA